MVVEPETFQAAENPPLRERVHRRDLHERVGTLWLSSEDLLRVLLHAEFWSWAQLI